MISIFTRSARFERNTQIVPLNGSCRSTDCTVAARSSAPRRKSHSAGGCQQRTRSPKAIQYALSRWDALTRYTSDGRLAIDNNVAERALRGIAKTRSLCPPSSSRWKHWNLIFKIGATRATCSRERRGHPFILHVRGSDLVWSSRHDLLGGQNAVPDQSPDAVMADLEGFAASDIVSHSPFFSAER